MLRILRQVIVVLLAAALLFGVDRVLNRQVNGQPVFNPFFLRILLLSGIFVTLAVSLNIVNGFTGQFSIGHAGFMAVGAYTAAGFTYKFADLTSRSPDLSLVIACIAGGAVAAIFGLIVGVPSLRLRGDYLAIVTLGFGEIIRVLLENTDKFPPIAFMSGAIGFSGIPKLTNFFWVFGLAAVTIAISRNLKRSLHGLAYLAIREDEVAADSMGINTTGVKVSAFVLAAFLAGAAGGLFAHNEQYIQPTQFNFLLSINIVVMVVLGGLGSITGSALTAIFFTALPEFLRSANTGFIAQYYKDEYRLVAFALLLALTMMLRPQGLFGRGEVTLFRRREEDVPPEGAAAEALKPTSAGATLNCQNVTKRFGGLTAVDAFHLDLKPGELVGLIGPNGAGKTTAFNLLTGVYEPTSGTILLDSDLYAGERRYAGFQRAMLLTWDAVLAGLGGFLIGSVVFSSVTVLNIEPTELLKVFPLAARSAITWLFVLGAIGMSLGTAPRRRINRPGLKPFKCANLGLSRTFQNIRLFPELTVLENVLVGAYGRRHTNLFSALLQTPAMLREEKEQRCRARKILDEFGLLDQEKEQARNLPYGDQRRLEIARALMTQPKLLLLDEPAAGMNPQEKGSLMSLIRKVRDEFGLTILLIEHDMKLVMGICERIYVLDYGRIIAEGTPDAIRSNPKVIAAYLGEDLGDADGDGVQDGEQKPATTAKTE